MGRALRFDLLPRGGLAVPFRGVVQGGLARVHTGSLGEVISAVATASGNHAVVFSAQGKSEVNIDARLMKNGSVSLSRVDEPLVEMQRRMICGTLREGRRVELSTLRPEGRFDYVRVGLTGVSEPRPIAARRLGRRTALTFPLPPPPQKN